MYIKCKTWQRFSPLKRVLSLIIRFLPTLHTFFSAFLCLAQRAMYVRLRDSTVWSEMYIVSGAPGWLSRLSVWLSISAQVMILWFVELSLKLGSAQSLIGILSPSLSAPTPVMLTLSLSQNKWINFKKLKNKIKWKKQQICSAISRADQGCCAPRVDLRVCG